jgi:hypothetical protein
MKQGVQSACLQGKVVGLTNIDILTYTDEAAICRVTKAAPAAGAG